MKSWQGEEQAKTVRLNTAAKALAGVRFAGMAIAIFGLMGPMVLLRNAGKTEASQMLVQVACKLCLWINRIPVTVQGQPMKHAGAVVANHSSWLDVFALNAAHKVLFVSKAEVKHWPLIGLISRSVGTVFIERRQSQAARHKTLFEERLLQGNRLLFFPEGTSTDGRRVLPFRSTLFAAFFEPTLRETMWIQPVSLIYIAPEGREDKFYGWWGEEDFAPSLLKVLGQWTQGRIEVVFHDPVHVDQMQDRKDLAKHCELAVRRGLADAFEVAD